MHVTESNNERFPKLPTRLPDGYWVYRKGFSLIELVISTALLALMTTILAILIDTTYYRSKVLNEQQSSVQQFIVAKEKLNLILRNSLLLKSQSTATEILYYKPHQQDTQFGKLNRINYAESTSWDESIIYAIRTVTEPSQEVILVQEIYQPSGSYSQRIILSRLGRKGYISFDYNNLPLVNVEIGGALKRRTNNLEWKRKFTIVIEHYK